VQSDQKAVDDTFKIENPAFTFSTTIDKRIKLEIVEKNKPVQEYISSITLSEATPEDIAKYIAKRVSGTSILIDIGCGIGYNTAYVRNKKQLF
jgi:protein-L-isoaspartate O-methyltransferase